MNNPLVSVIIPLFNREKLVVETLQSVINQTFQNWEAIVVDDGSMDNSYEVVKEISKTETRIKLFKRYREPKGAPTCRNIGIEKSQGDYIIFLDSDDLLADFCLENRVKAFDDNPDLDFLVFQTLLFKEKINDTNILWNTIEPNNYLFRFLRLEPPWGIHSVLWKHKTFINNINSDETLLSFQDWDLHINAILNKLNFKYLNKIDSYCRTSVSHETIGKESISNKHLNSHEYLFNKTKASIKKTKINKDENIIIALSALFFWLENQYLLKNNRAKALEIWRKNIEYKTFLKDIIVALYIMFYKKRGFLYFKKFFYKIMPDIYFNHFRYTFRNTKNASTHN